LADGFPFTLFDFCDLCLVNEVSYNKDMATIDNYLDRYFEPVTTVFTPEVAQKIISLEPDPEVAARITELGEKASAGTLSADEFDEYEWYVDAGDFISLFKAKARRYLASHASQE